MKSPLSQSLEQRGIHLFIRILWASGFEKLPLLIFVSKPLEDKKKMEGYL